MASVSKRHHYLSASNLRSGMLLLTFVLAAISGFTQNTRPAAIRTCIAGKVTDLNGKPLAGISLRIENLKTHRQVVVATDKAGRFSVERTTPVRYSIAVEPLLTIGPNGVRVTLDSDEVSTNNSVQPRPTSD